MTPSESDPHKSQNPSPDKPEPAEGVPPTNTPPSEFPTETILPETPLPESTLPETVFPETSLPESDPLTPPADDDSITAGTEFPPDNVGTTEHVTEPTAPAGHTDHAVTPADQNNTNTEPANTAASAQTPPPAPQPARPQPARPQPVTPTPVPVPAAELPVPDIQLRLPNGKVNVPYTATLQGLIREEKLPAGTQADQFEVVFRQVAGLDAIGLNVEVTGSQAHVTGTPQVPGDHKIVVDYTAQHTGRSDRPMTTRRKQVMLTINPDPQSLWKDLESDPSLPYQKPTTAAERKAETSQAVLLAASRRGRSHAHDGTFRDDDFRLGTTADGWHFLAVADGAGTYEYSREGSRLACETAWSKLEQHFGGVLGDAFSQVVTDYHQQPADDSLRQIRNTLYQTLGTAGHAAFQAIKEEAVKLDCPPKKFSTTLIMTICRRFDFGWFVGAFAIGDGGAAIYRANDDVLILNDPDSGEFAGETRFVTMSDLWQSGEQILKRIKFHIVPDLTAVIAMTDGVSDPKFETDDNFFSTEKWHGFWADLHKDCQLDRDNEQAHEELLEWMNFWSPGNHDDRTLAMLLP